MALVKRGWFFKPQTRFDEFAFHFKTLLCLLHWPVEKASIICQKWRKNLAWKMKMVYLTRDDSALLHQWCCLPLSTGQLTRVQASRLVRLLVPIHCILIFLLSLTELTWSYPYDSLHFLSWLTEYIHFSIIIPLWNTKHRRGHLVLINQCV